MLIRRFGSSSGNRMTSPIISSADLADHLDDPDWRIIDCRFDLGQPDAGREAYREGHIPGALYAHLEQDLSGPVSETSGRHPLPDPEALRATFSRWGITPTTRVVCYDYRTNAYAGRLWWLLRWLGHERVAVLDGGFEKWLAEERPVSDAVPDDPPPAEFRGGPDPALTVSSETIFEDLDDGELCLIDVRAEPRFNGDEEPIDPVAGHIPGAVNLPFAKNLDVSGCYLPPEALRKMYARILGDHPPQACVVMCGSGVTACQSLIALEQAGLDGARLYPGSWSEWIRDPNRPVEIGGND